VDQSLPDNDLVAAPNLQTGLRGTKRFFLEGMRMVPIHCGTVLLILVVGHRTALVAQATPSDTAEVRTAVTARRSVRPNQASITLQFTATVAHQPERASVSPPEQTACGGP